MKQVTIPLLAQKLKEESEAYPSNTEKDRKIKNLLKEASEEIQILRIALADAIRRPMGVIPASAENRITNEELDIAEAHRVKFKSGGRVYDPWNSSGLF